VNLASLWSWLVEKDAGALTIATLVVALAVSVATILKLLAERRKFRSEARKAEADARAAERQELKSELERLQDCARNILRSVSATVIEIHAIFSLFAYAAEGSSPKKVQEATRGALQFRYEQRYRMDIETFSGELGAHAGRFGHEIIGQLRLKAISLLAKIAEKKELVARIEAEGLNRETSAAVAAWLDDIREIESDICSLVGRILGMSLGEDREDDIGRAA
jgi:hypothetical protein